MWVMRRLFFFQAEDGIRDLTVTGVQTCALPISSGRRRYRRTAGSAWTDRRPVSGIAVLRIPQRPRTVLLAGAGRRRSAGMAAGDQAPARPRASARSEEHTSELQSQSNLVCRLLLEKKKNDCTATVVCISA